ncbi:hypothetical protein HDE76_001487 [Rhodanobacter sp. ANJX3]|uniref:hypothetical protein n=1 Tax=Rhodanobacter sp. ANJX3 TaxID=2723083 RepID=UPI00161E64C7|nr:hypothetical protein [Rhodanobacter sp. ANJX3]MBB5358281.1 hypothetical protein [Rhodanobacter sp. ANJX3]
MASIESIDSRTTSGVDHVELMILGIGITNVELIPAAAFHGFSMEQTGVYNRMQSVLGKNAFFVFVGATISCWHDDFPEIPCIASP